MEQLSSKTIEPLNLSGNLSENFKKFIQRWNIYSLATGTNTKDEQTKCAIFLFMVGEEAIEIYNTFEFPDASYIMGTNGIRGNIKDLNGIIKKFKDYCEPQKNVGFERYIFNNIRQSGRSLVIFLTELKNKVKSCEYGTLAESIILDRIIIGLDDDAVRERLLRNKNLTLKDAVDMIHTMEYSKGYAKEIKMANNVETKNNYDADAVTKYGHPNKRTTDDDKRGFDTNWRGNSYNKGAYNTNNADRRGYSYKGGPNTIQNADRRGYSCKGVLIRNKILIDVVTVIKGTILPIKSCARTVISHTIGMINAQQ